MNAANAFTLVSSRTALPIYSRSRQSYVGQAVYDGQAAANGVGFLGGGSLGYLPVGSTYREGVGIRFQSWFGSLYDGGGRMGGEEGATNFLSEKTAQILWYITSVTPGGQATPQNSKAGVTFLPSGGSYNTGAQDLVRDTLANIVFSESCAKAFKDTGLKTPFELLIKGIVIGPATLLTNPTDTATMGITEYARQRDVRIVGSTSTQAITIRDHSGYKPDTIDGRPRIFLNTSAFGGGAYPLREVLTHELLHAAGVDAKDPGFFGSIFGKHDLSYYDKYQAIIDACNKN